MLGTLGTRGPVAFTTRLLAATKAIWYGGSPFAALTVIWPTNEQGKYEIEAEGIRLAFTNHGAAVTNVWIKDADGEEIDVVLGLDHADMYPHTDSNPYLNGVIGRYAGYLSGGGYEVDGAWQKVWANAHDGVNTYNGGNKGWGRADWEVPYHQKNSILFVMFDFHKNGFPGIFVSCITHTVYANEWHISYGVTPLNADGGGPLNMGHQVFFNLDGMRTGNETAANTVLDHTLHLPKSGLRFGADENGVPTGDLLSNRKGKEYDFWSGPKLLQETMNHVDSLDEKFMISHKHWDTKMDTPSAILSSARSGITMEMFTDQDSLHAYTWDPKNGPVRLKTNQGNDTVPVHGAISLTQGDWPDGVNHPEWLNRKTLWGNMDIYKGAVAYKFKRNRKELQ